jgi:hypothetical protein
MQRNGLIGSKGEISKSQRLLKPSMSEITSPKANDTQNIKIENSARLPGHHSLSQPKIFSNS